jgi:hypothetical protein
MTMLDLKSNKTDMHTNMQAIDILHKQIKHLAVMLVEMLRKDTLKHIKVPENEQTVKNNTLGILQQGLSIAKWINKYGSHVIYSLDLTLKTSTQTILSCRKIYRISRTWSMTHYKKLKKG